MNRLPPIHSEHGHAPEGRVDHLARPHQVPLFFHRIYVVQLQPATIHKTVPVGIGEVQYVRHATGGDAVVVGKEVAAGGVNVGGHVNCRGEGGGREGEEALDVGSEFRGVK